MRRRDFIAGPIADALGPQDISSGRPTRSRWAWKLWDLTSGAETARLEGHSDSVVALCLLPDGRLASGSWDNTIRLWDIAARREITRLEIDAPVRCFASLVDNRLVAGNALGRMHWLEIVI
jgi:WD40 repeat protein